MCTFCFPFYSSFLDSDLWQMSCIPKEKHIQMFIDIVTNDLRSDEWIPNELATSNASSDVYRLEIKCLFNVLTCHSLDQPTDRSTESIDQLVSSYCVLSFWLRAELRVPSFFLFSFQLSINGRAQHKCYHTAEIPNLDLHNTHRFQFVRTHYSLRKWIRTAINK